MLQYTFENIYHKKFNVFKTICEKFRLLKNQSQKRRRRRKKTYHVHKVYETPYSIVSHLLVNESYKYENNGKGNNNRNAFNI